MTTLTATAQPGYVALALTDAAADAVATITRDPSPGTITVRGTPAAVTAGGGLVLTDVEHPFGVTVTYTAVLRDPDTNATIDSVAAVLDPVTLPDPGGMVVSDPFTGAAVTVPVWDERDERHTARSYRYDLAGYRLPVFLTEQHAGPVWTVELLTTRAQDRPELLDLLTAGAPVLLRTAGDCDLHDGWVMPGDVDVARRTRRASDERRMWSVQVAAVDPPGSGLESVAVTLLDLHEYEPGTLTDLAGRAATLLDLSRAVVGA